VFDDLPPDLDRLQTLRTWHLLWVRRINAKIEALQRRHAEEEHGRQGRPAPPEWIVELGIGAGRPPVQVHAGNCYMTGKRRRPVDRGEARRLLAAGLAACTHCRPDAQLHIIDLAAPRAATPGAPVSADPEQTVQPCSPYGTHEEAPPTRGAARTAVPRASLL
jgi:hypothetical protein